MPIDPERVQRQNEQRLRQLEIYNATEWPVEPLVEEPQPFVAQENSPETEIQVRTPKRFRKEPVRG